MAENIDKIILTDSGTVLNLIDSGALRQNGEEPLTGNLEINRSGISSLVNFQQGGTTKGYVGYDPTNARTILNSIAGGRMTLSDGGDIYLVGSNGNIYLRPAGTSANQVYWDSGGQQHGGHPLVVNEKVLSGANISITAGGATYKTIASVTGLNSAGVYLFTGKVGFSPSSATVSEAKICLSNTTNANNLGIGNSRRIETSVNVMLNVSMILTGYSSIYLTFGSSGVDGTVASYIFTGVRLS